MKPMTLLVVLLIAAAAVADESIDGVEKQLDRVVDLFESGSGQLASAMLDEAVKALDAAVKQTPDDAKAHFLRGRAYVYRGEKGDDGVADAAYARAAELAPDNAEYQFQHGLRLAGAGKIEQATAVFKRAVKLDPKHVQATSMLGVVHAQAGDDAAALEWFAKAVELDPRHATAHGNIGQIYQNQGKAEEALAAYDKAVAAAPQDWRHQAKLVQVYQALGRTDDRDRARAVLKEMWDEDKVDQPMYCREQFEAGGKKVQAYEYFELRGERAMRYAFFVMKPDGKQPEHRITLGSYEMTTQIAREAGEIGEDERMFHLDGYYEGGEHRTFGMFKKEPTYEATRVRVVQVLEGKLRAASSSKPGKGKNLDIEVEAAE